MVSYSRFHFGNNDFFFNHVGGILLQGCGRWSGDIFPGEAKDTIMTRTDDLLPVFVKPDNAPQVGTDGRQCFEFFFTIVNQNKRFPAKTDNFEGVDREAINVPGL